MMDREKGFTLEGKNVVVVGLGKTGFKVAEFLCERGANVTVTDTKAAEDIEGIGELEEKGARVKVGGHTPESFEGAELVIASPGVELNVPALKLAADNGAEVVRDIELASIFITKPILAVTGTNGKSTTTELIGEIIRASGKKVFVGGNIGTPAIECVAKDDEIDYCALEISSFHLEAIKTFAPHVAVLLNVTEDHLDRYSDFDEYAGTKFRVFENQRVGDFAIVNAGCPVITEDLGRISAKMIPFSSRCELDEGLYLKDGEICFSFEGKEERYPVSGPRLTGVQNTENIMAAIATARVLGIEQGAIIKAIESFRGLPHRMEFVRELDGVRYFNDSKATNVGALWKALSGIDGKVVLIAGGRDKGGDYRGLVDVVREKVKVIITIGEASGKIRDALGGSTDVWHAASMEEAVTRASEMATAGDTVLLSPACSSFDMFKSFEARGEVFKRLVEGL